MARATRKNGIDLFIEGSRSGWTIGCAGMLPNVMMAFVIIQILMATGLMDKIGSVAGPIMALWGLPGEAIMVLLGSFMAMGGGVGVCAGLWSAGKLANIDVATLAPAIMLMGAMVQYMGRCLGTADANRKYWAIQIGISVVNALVGMWMTRLIIVLFIIDV